ncbi:NAD-dependent epimerase/dehydratase family protein [Flavobacterium sp. HJJ]|uniref:NAD-dependent epimerase/dehydratase family protein n=1 Tax=Flavobacterium sp. HJJ TaxID=2783792 RepID=UPI00188C8151|nr:NAD(P)-dependent oxidoreductase [Flavobacterium sp. HJJ]MBF4470267.1 NAD(P)-dependent oxidoreductase [Flavobacterium sp. HJJ]
MVISIIGTNGLLATELGLFCNQNQISIKAFGRNKPITYSYNEFEMVDLLHEQINIDKILDSNIIFYTAGAGIQSNLDDSEVSIYQLNTFIPIHLCKELSKKGFNGTFVTFGSCFEIGNNDKSVLFSEKEVVCASLDVPNDYCISKRLLTRYVTSDKKVFKHLHIVLPTIYGEKEAPHRLIPYVVTSIKNNKPMQFTQGLQVRQYLYVGDIPAIVFDLISLSKEGVFNISGTETFSVRQIIEMIYKFYGLEISEELFGKAERADVGMLNLQLDDSELKKILREVKYTRFIDSLKIYDKCL